MHAPFAGQCASLVVPAVSFELPTAALVEHSITIE